MALKYQAQKAQDLVACYGGEEFSLILPNTDQVSAVHVGNSLQAQVRDLQIVHDGSAINQYVTMSLGVATIIPTWKSSTSDLIIKADKALTLSKISMSKLHYLKLT
ncbi:GGDEF domain-containing protein [Nostoc sp. CALU 546]|uniref:GGDEF domain-containing protein n=1 Tax=Nostoc sp. CALU 546 TaxID=1867241 RepID=UPI003B682297